MFVLSNKQIWVGATLGRQFLSVNLFTVNASWRSQLVMNKETHIVL